MELSKKWFNKLTNEEILEVHKKAIGNIDVSKDIKI